jgi:Pao retrotransposon peptidase
VCLHVLYPKVGYFVAQHTQQQIFQLLRKGGFNLRKWASNSNKLLSSLPAELKTEENLDINQENSIKTLGIQWNPSKDEFLFKLQKIDSRNELTKRTILSIISSIYDPLGWLSPITVKAKILVQDLWKSNITWDEKLPTEINQTWMTFLSELQETETFRIPRWTSYSPIKQIEIHGFCDASEKAYAAVLYTRITESSGVIRVTK